MSQRKPANVAVLIVALPLFVLSLYALLTWQTGPGFDEADFGGTDVPSDEWLAPGSWEEEPVYEPTPSTNLAAGVKQDSSAADVPPMLVGPDRYTPPTVPIAQRDTFATPVVPDDRSNDRPSVTSPVLESAASSDGTSRDLADLDPEPSSPSDVVPVPVVTPVWPPADSLVAQIDQLAELEPGLAKWCEAVKVTLEDLRRQGELGSDSSHKLLAALQQLKEHGEQEAAAHKGQPASGRVLRVTLSLARRLAMWNVAARWSPQETHVALPLAFDPPTEWATTLQTVRTFLLHGTAAQTWVKYLKLAELDRLASLQLSEDERRELAREVLRRMHSSQLTDEQLQLLSQPPFDKLSEQLRIFAEEPLDMVRLLAELERFETTPLSVNARPVSYQYEIARWSFDPVERELAELMNAHYRNANVRVAISAELLNRVLPEMTHNYEYVNDNIQGAAVQGESHSATRLRVILLPDRWRWRMGLEARGEVNSSTSSTKGPATFYQDGYSQFRARKLMTIDRRNINLFDAEATAASNNTLRDYQTDYDGIPIFNAIARSIARQQYDETAGVAKHEVEHKIAGRASRTLDEQVDARVSDASNKLKSQLLAPLQALDLDPTAIDMETTNSRLIARYRLAGHEQLGSSTPRPQAPGDSWLSAQIHQSAVNNMLLHLRLEGQKKELRALYAEISALFVRKAVKVPDDIPDNVFATFSEHDAVFVDCDQGRVRLTIRLKELAHENTRFKNFEVRAYYVPDPDQKSANLVRDGVIELSGKSLRLGDQIALRGIFSKVLSKNRRINLINESLAKSKGLKDLHVSQFAIQDGWVGIALTPGPQRPILYTKPPVKTPDEEPRASTPPVKPVSFR